ncbi:MAG: ABC transporter ATP-binding protein [Calditrichaeota bacterium]|nr:MAG: ABC transporter ATP-binding protein [Calditrichota bacterium]
MALIETESVTKIYDGRGVVPVRALNKVSLCFEPGEFSAIVGPSGSGKTTLLNVLGGLDMPEEGRVVVDGQDLGRMKDADLVEFRLRHIGFIFQAYNLIPVFTARENVEFIMLLQGVDKEERRERAVQLLKEVGLGDRVDNRPNQLSGGQQQRVAVARALASRPRFVLADEPTANLDSVSAEALLDLMEQMNEKYGMTFIFSTHDARVIKRARRVITLQDGQVKQ